MPTPAKLGSLPSRLASLAAFDAVAPGIAKIENRIARLRAQAFALLVREVFEAMPDLRELEVLGDGADQPVFSSFSVPATLTRDPPPADGASAPASDLDDMEDELAGWSDTGTSLDLPPALFTAFEELSPYTREDYPEQLREAYEQALAAAPGHAATAPGQGGWESFWPA